MDQAQAVVDEILEPADVEKLLKISESTLAGWRYTGTGPRWFRAGKHVRYRRRDVVAWIDEQLERSAS